MKRFFTALREELAAWGFPRAAPRPSGVSRVRVVAPEREGKRAAIVGELFQDGPDFVFRYSPTYRSSPDANPLPSFPDLRKPEYRSRTLFPFFATRMPPVDRADVQDALRRLQLSADDPLRLLGLLARRGIANPYEFELAEPA